MLPNAWPRLRLATPGVVRAFGRARGALLGLFCLGAVGVGWWLTHRAGPPSPRPSAGPAQPAQATVPSSRCAECHPSQYEAWHRTYHRTMTRDAIPENVKGDFADVVYDYQGLPTRLSREGDTFFMETVAPDWAALRARAGRRTDLLPPPRFVRLRVDRVVGSHWIQEYLHRAPNGRYLRLPVLYHLVERRWTQSNGAFLTPDTDDFWQQCRSTSWNQTCLFCHNTDPSQNPVRGPGGEVIGFESTVAELGIACAACHGPGREHVRLMQGLPGGENDVVHPAHLAIPRRDEICARCHGAIVPRAWLWDPHTHRDPFIPGQELTRYNDFFWSEAEQVVLARRGQPIGRPGRPEPTDGRFWGDGTPLTTALEYNGMALSACYQEGRGKLSCLSCHTMHRGDPNFQLKPRMETNDACYQCHSEYRSKLAAHTRHPAGSPGSVCYNCHMPHQVYSLLTTHRSHRIQVPDLASSLGTGKPHACNLCHLDRSLGWTREQLARWPGGRRRASPRLSAEEESVSAAVLALARGDARTRVVVAGAFSSPAAQKASGSDWFGSFLTRLLEEEGYPAVRYLAHRGLRTAYGETAAGPFDPLATPDQRRAQLRALRIRFDATPIRRALPYLPLTPQGLPDEATLNRLRAGRQDPEVQIHE